MWNQRKRFQPLRRKHEQHRDPSSFCVFKWLYGSKWFRKNQFKAPACRLMARKRLFAQIPCEISRQELHLNPDSCCENCTSRFSWSSGKKSSSGLRHFIISQRITENVWANDESRLERSHMDLNCTRVHFNRTVCRRTRVCFFGWLCIEILPNQRTGVSKQTDRSWTEAALTEQVWRRPSSSFRFWDFQIRGNL